MTLPISNAEYVYRELRKKILTTEIPSGEKIVIREWCRNFGVSNGPVIEAIRRLEQEGLVVSRLNVGAVVPKWSSSEIVRAFITRNAVDGAAARLFVEFATEQQKEQLMHLNDEFRRAVLKQQAAECREADINFHLHIVTSVMPLPVQKMMQSLYAITMTASMGQPGIMPSEIDVAAHDELAAIFTGDDADEAERAAFYHVSRFDQMIERGLVKEEDVPLSVIKTGCYELTR